VLSGVIVLLNGTSSAGKTSVARAVQQLMDEPFLHTGIDEYSPHVPAKFTTVSGGPNPDISPYFTLIYRDPPARIVAQTPVGERVYGDGLLVDVRTGPEGVRLRAAGFVGIAAMAAVGVNLVVDEVLFDPLVLRAAVLALAESDVLFVGLRLPLAVAEQREQDRGDRGPGGARLFYDRVHAHGLYDLEVDTSAASPEECALRIRTALAEGHPRRAIRQLARRFAA
jgi:chloramphenicol 3-O phosphotransferase